MVLRKIVGRAKGTTTGRKDIQFEVCVVVEEEEMGMEQGRGRGALKRSEGYSCCHREKGAARRT